MILVLQERLKTLIDADTWFAGVKVLTEKYGDLENRIEREVARASRCIIIRTAEGQLQDESRLAHFKERLIVDIVKPASGDWNLVTALEHAVLAIHQQPVVANGQNNRQFSVTSHRSVVIENEDEEQETILAQQLLIECVQILNSTNVST